MKRRPQPEGQAIVFCESAFNTPNGKTAHGLVRFTERYRVQSVIDSRYSGRDAGEVLDGRPKGIPIYSSLAKAISASQSSEWPPTHFVIGLAPDGGRLDPGAREAVKEAIRSALNVDSGLHDFLSDDAEIASLAARKGVEIRDIRKPPDRKALHFFTGRVEEVESFKVALLGTDSAVGKRTTAWLLVHALRALGRTSELIGTGQTAWMQGARYGIILDSLVNDFVSGEIEHAIWSCWKDLRPQVMVLEGQGSLMNPAYPGGFELLAAGRPDLVVLQHAPARRDYDGFPGYPIHPLPRQIQAIELLSDRPVVAVTINHEEIPTDRIAEVCEAIQVEIGLPIFDVLKNGADDLARLIESRLPGRASRLSAKCSLP
jgi:uncharacterized NAD-dependent epimerase/dehydratase family protein